jgi:uncharacterized phage protein gp47/JayE
LRQVRESVRGEVTASLGRATFVGNSVLRVMADATAALTHLTLRYIDWLALQFLPDTAETEWIDRHGAIWLSNADGTFGRKNATLAEGTALVTGVPGAFISAATQLDSGEITYETLLEAEVGTVATSISIRALTPGVVGNLDNGTPLHFVNVLANVDDPAYVFKLTGGTDDETDEELRLRVLQRIRETPMGGDAQDYVRWALAVPGVTRAWCYPLEMGIGTVTVRFMMDDLRQDDNLGFPLPEDVTAVETYVNTQRPVAVKDIFIVAPLKQFMEVVIVDLVPDTSSIREEIEDSLKRMLIEVAKPGQTIYSVWKTYAVMGTSDVVSFRLYNDEDEVMESPGHMAVLGTVLWDEPEAVVPPDAIPIWGDIPLPRPTESKGLAQGGSGAIAIPASYGYSRGYGGASGVPASRGRATGIGGARAVGVKKQ